jgi:hypothetical protein
MSAAAHSAQRIAGELHRITAYTRARLTPEDWDILGSHPTRKAA